MKTVRWAGVACLVLVLAAAAWAGPADHIRGRIESLQQRIDNGVQSGKLTGQEARSIQNKLDTIRRGFENAVQNGLSPREAKLYNKRLDDLSKQIYQERHDREDTQSAGRIEHRFTELQQRIDEGARSGALTPAETKNLQSRLEGIRTHYGHAQRDGKLTDQEIRSIQARLDALSKSILKERRDRERSR